MSVQVTTNTNSAGGNKKIDTHPTGVAVEVKDGHLFVNSELEMRPWTRVAIYAPEKWASVVVDQNSQVQTP